MILASTVLSQYTHVTDGRQTDRRQTDDILRQQLDIAMKLSAQFAVFSGSCLLPAIFNVFMNVFIKQLLASI